MTPDPTLKKHLINKFISTIFEGKICSFLKKNTLYFIKKYVQTEVEQIRWYIIFNQFRI